MTNLTDEQRKDLTLFLGNECYHEIIHEQDRYWHWYCKICNKEFPNPDFRNAWKPRTFTTDKDFGDLARKMVEEGMWVSFFLYARGNCDWEGFDVLHGDNLIEYFTAWLITDPKRFCWLVSEFLTKTEVKG